VKVQTEILHRLGARIDNSHAHDEGFATAGETAG